MIAELFTYMDIAIAVLLIIAGILGAVKGFAKQIFSLVSFILIVIFAGFFCDELASFLEPVFGESLAQGFSEWMASKDADGIFTTTKNWGELNNASQILSQLGIPGFIVKIISPSIGETIRGFGSCVLIEKFPPVLAFWALNAICFIVITLVIAIIMHLIKKAVFKALEKPALSAVNRFFGFVVGALYSYAVWSVVLVFVMTFVSDMGLFSEIQYFLVEQATLSATGKFPIFYHMYNYNIIGNWVLQLFTSSAL